MPVDLRSGFSRMVLLMLLPLLFLGSVAAQSSPRRGIAALINGKPITVHELDQAVARRLLSLASRYPEEVLRGQEEQIRGDTLTELITERLLLQRCTVEKIEVRPEEVDHWVQMQIDRLRSEDDAIRTVGDFFERWEADYGENEELARQNIRDQIRISTLLDTKIYQQEYISPAEMRAYYRRHPDEFSTESAHVFRQILINLDNPDMKELLAAIERDVAAGRDFGEMVIEYSQGPRAEDGGQYDMSDKALDSWWKPLPEAIRALPIGVTSSPLNAPSAVHFVQLIDHRIGHKLEFQECQLQIRSKLRKERELQQRERFNDELRRNADIQTNPEGAAGYGRP